MSDAARRDLERVVQPRSLYVRGRTEPRLSREDEDRFVDEARERQKAEVRAHVARIERKADGVQSATDELRQELGRLDRATYRDLDQIRRALNRIKVRCGV